MHARLLAALGLVTACGGGDPAGDREGEPLAPAADLTIVAHPGDDLLFMQPELHDAVQRGTGLTNVYVTAEPLAMAGPRQDGLKAAYSAIAGDSAWACGTIEIADIAVEHCRLAAAKLSLVMLGYPEGGGDGAAANSLLHLWEGAVTSVPGVGKAPSTFDQVALIQLVTAIIDQTAPTTIRTTEIASTHGADDSDRMLVGALAVLAIARSTQDPQLLSYRGDNISAEPANADPAIHDRSAGILARYAACATGCAPCGSACAVDQLDPIQLGWLDRRYVTEMQRTAGGVLRLATSCIVPAGVGANPSLGDCATAPTWQLDAHGTLRTAANLCLEVFFTGEIIGNTCRDAGPGGRFFLDTEGHLWSGTVPTPQDDMAFDHLDCVGSSAGRPRAELCGAGRAPTWAVDR
jgi:hypothetical protein